MNDEMKYASASDAPAEMSVSSAAVESRVGSSDDEMQFLSDAIRSLPSYAVKDLLSVGVCVRCSFRLLGIEQQIYCSSSFSPSLLCSLLEESTSPAAEVESEFCSVCLGILQFKWRDDKETLVKKESSNDMTELIAETVKQEGHQIDSFSLEVSVPQAILENELAILSDMKSKYGSELWFQEKSLSEPISVKDALKFAIVKPLESLLGIKSSIDSFRIRLTYTSTKASKMVQNSRGRIKDCKRQKTDTNNGLHSVNDESIVAGAECSDQSNIETNAAAVRPSNGLQACDAFECLGFSIEKVNEPCQLELQCYRTPIYLGGRYLKFSRNVSQTCWIIGEERMGEASVEEIIGSNILPMCKGDNYKFHAAGREDIDVRMLGSGRPFLVEIQNARQIPSEAIVKEIETRINGLENKLVGVKNLKVVGSEGWTLMREGESEKQKQYAALVWISRPLDDEDLKTISSLKDMQIMQKTPIRVLHRRSPLEREKLIHWMKIERIAGSSQYFLLYLCTQAGTYIKEFVHGDLGRTHPSVGSILGCRAEIMQLDVTNVKMDCFLTG
ncbi:hypothetical protein SLE2022_173160 [Rubroshorea leprosula]